MQCCVNIPGKCIALFEAVKRSLSFQDDDMWMCGIHFLPIVHLNWHSLDKEVEIGDTLHTQEGKLGNLCISS